MHMCRSKKFCQLLCFFLFSLWQLTLKKGAPGDQVWDLVCVQLASYLKGGSTDVDDAPTCMLIKNPIMTWYEGRKDPRAINGPPPKRHLLTFRWRAIECWLGSFMHFSGESRNPISLWFFRGGGGGSGQPLSPLPLDPHMDQLAFS